jgi:hypothetical protein
VVLKSAGFLQRGVYFLVNSRKTDDYNNKNGFRQPDFIGLVKFLDADLAEGDGAGNRKQLHSTKRTPGFISSH